MKHYNVKKIANTIIYFIDKDVKFLGATKLMKLCFYADKYHLEEYGTPIFKHSYTKMDFGPVPMWLYGLVKSSICGITEFDDLEEETKIFNEYINLNQVYYGREKDKKQTVFIKKSDFDIKFFSKSQLKILDRVISEFKCFTATELSELSHKTNAWKNVDFDEEITYASMVENEDTSSYISFLENEKGSFYRNYKISKLNRAC